MANVCTYKGKILVHVRKFNWYNGRWHPTDLGIAMNQEAFSSFLASSYKVTYELDFATAVAYVNSSNSIQATVNPAGKTVTLNKETTYKSLTKKTSIELSKTQWENLMEQVPHIQLSVECFKLDDMDITSCYEEYVCFDNPREPTMPEQESMKECLHTAFRTHIVKKGDLKPERYIEKTNYLNSLPEFVSAVQFVRIYDVIDEFISALPQTNGNPSLLNLVSRDFMKSIKFTDIVMDAKRRLVD